jgi:hypothetical protein
MLVCCALVAAIALGCVGELGGTATAGGLALSAPKERATTKGDIVKVVGRERSAVVSARSPGVAVAGGRPVSSAW